MKKLLLLLLVTGYTNLYSQELIPNTKGQESLIGTINNQITSGKISEKAVIYVNEEKINTEELTLLNEFDLKDFITIDFLNKKEAAKNFKDDAEYGVIIIKTFIDKNLTPEFYKGINNTTVLEKINILADNKSIKRNPLLVVDGIPLRGTEIVDTINKLDGTSIKQINLLKKIAALRIYGIRAINGVLLISTK